jgi:hypothetical protein
MRLLRRLILAFALVLLTLQGELRAQVIPAGPPVPVTITIASPAVVTWGWGNHGLWPGEQIILYTTGALPTGLFNLATYFVVGDSSFSLTSFHIATAPNGTPINTTGTQSGAQYAAAVPSPGTSIFNPGATLTLPTRANIASGSNSVTAASPCVFTWTANGMTNGQTAVLSGTTAPGTGQFVNGSVYYIVAQATNTVELAATRGGAALNCPTTAGVAETLTMTYEPNELIANSIANGSVASNPIQISAVTGAAIIPYLTLQTSATSGWGGVAVSINLWKAQPTYGNGDGGAYVVSTGSANYIATLTGTLTQFGDGAVANFFLSPQVAALTRVSSGQIYWDLQIIGSAVPISGQTFSLTAGVLN